MIFVWKIISYFILCLSIYIKNITKKIHVKLAVELCKYFHISTYDNKIIKCKYSSKKVRSFSSFFCYYIFNVSLQWSLKAHSRVSNCSQRCIFHYCDRERHFFLTEILYSNRFFYFIFSDKEYNNNNSV